MSKRLNNRLAGEWVSYVADFSASVDENLSEKDTALLLYIRSLARDSRRPTSNRTEEASA